VIKPRAAARLIGGGATKLIDYLVRDIPDARIGFTLLLSSQPFAGYRVQLNRIAEEDGSCSYRGRNHNAEAWLCPALLTYFETPLASLYLKAEPKR